MNFPRKTALTQVGLRVEAKTWPTLSWFVLLPLLLSPVLSLAQDGPLKTAPARSAAVLVHQEKGMFGFVRVVDRGDHRSLVFVDDAERSLGAGDEQSWIVKGDPRALPMEYLRSAAVALAFSPSSVLLIGLGGGAFGSFLHAHQPALDIEAVEIDPVVTKIARSYFSLPAVVVVTTEDGAQFMQKAQKRWGLILIDAYGSDDYPKQMGTPQFFAQVMERLDATGSAVLNIAAESETTEERLLRRFNKVSTSCFVVPVAGDDSDNLVLIGSKQRLSLAQLMTLVRQVDASFPRLPLAKLVHGAKPCLPVLSPKP